MGSFWKEHLIGYHNLYLNVDILLVPCVFETFRKESSILFDLDPAHYLSTPGYSWDAMLRFADLNLKPISNTERYQFIENTIRVGILWFAGVVWKLTISFKNSMMPIKPTSYIIYLNSNNLYGNFLMQLLLTQILDWVMQKYFNLNSYPINSPIGSLLKVDIDYPDESHNLYNNYLFSRWKNKSNRRYLNIKYKS